MQSFVYSFENEALPSFAPGLNARERSLALSQPRGGGGAVPVGPAVAGNQEDG